MMCCLIVVLASAVSAAAQGFGELTGCRSISPLFRLETNNAQMNPLVLVCPRPRVPSIAEIKYREDTQNLVAIQNQLLCVYSEREESDPSLREKLQEKRRRCIAKIHDAIVDIGKRNHAIPPDPSFLAHRDRPEDDLLNQIDVVFKDWGRKLDMEWPKHIGEMHALADAFCEKASAPCKETKPKFLGFIPRN